LVELPAAPVTSQSRQWQAGGTGGGSSDSWLAALAAAAATAATVTVAFQFRHVFLLALLVMQLT